MSFERIKNILSTFFISGLLYLGLLLPLQKIAALFPGTGVRPSSFLPPVLGIIGGWPAACAVALANFCSDMIALPASPHLLASAILGALINFCCAYGAYILWYRIWPKNNRAGIFLRNILSLEKFVTIIAITALLTAALVSLDLYFYAGTAPSASWLTLFLNNLEFGIIFGVPALSLFPFLRMSPVLPRERTRTMPAIVAKVCGIIGAATLLAYVGSLIITGRKPPELQVFFVIIFCLGAFSLFLLQGGLPPQKSQGKFDYKDTIKTQVLVIFSVASMVLALLISAVIYYEYSKSALNFADLWTRVFSTTALLLNFVLATFIVLMRFIERRLTTPLSALAEKVAIQGKDELDVLSRSLDFVVMPQKGHEPITNEHRMFIGLNDKDANAQLIDSTTARSMIGKVCLNHVSGYTATGNASGGWVGEDNIVFLEEEAIVYTIFGATDEQIHAIIQELLPLLNIEAILLEKNGSDRTFVGVQ